METFDDLYERKMRNGKYQLGLGIIGAFLNLLDGAFFTVVPFCVRFMQLDHFLTNDQASLLSSGMLAGSIVAGPLATFCLSHFGRHFTMSFAVLIGLVAGCTLFFSDSFVSILASVGFLGVYDTMAISCLMLYLVETMTGANKGKIIVSVYSFFSIGRLFGTILARFTLTPYQLDQWKVPVFLLCFILVVVYYPIVFFLRESVKYSVHRKLEVQAIEDFNAIQRFNHPEPHLKANGLLLSRQDFRRLSSLDGPTTSVLDAPRAAHSTVYYLIQTFCFAAAIVCTLYTFIIHTMIVPFIMGTDSSSLTDYIIIMSGELLGVVIMMAFIEHRLVGRKRIVVLSHLLMAASFFAYVVYPSLPITIVMYVAKIFLKSALSTSFIHLNESFPIAIRAKVVMFVTTVVNISSIGAPFLFFKAQTIGQTPAVFSLAGLLSLAAFVFNIPWISDLQPRTPHKVFDALEETPDDENMQTIVAEQHLP